MTTKNWIQKALPKVSKGKLHKNLGIPEGERIPAKKLEKASHSKSPIIKKQTTLAKTLNKLRGK